MCSCPACWSVEWIGHSSHVGCKGNSSIYSPLLAGWCWCWCRCHFCCQASCASAVTELRCLLQHSKLVDCYCQYVCVCVDSNSELVLLWGKCNWTGFSCFVRRPACKIAQFAHFDRLRSLVSGVLWLITAVCFLVMTGNVVFDWTLSSLARCLSCVFPRHFPSTWTSWGSVCCDLSYPDWEPGHCGQAGFDYDQVLIGKAWPAVMTSSLLLKYRRQSQFIEDASESSYLSENVFSVYFR